MNDLTFGKAGIVAVTFGGRACKSAAPVRPSSPRAPLNPDQPLDAVWIVLEAANDLADTATVEICRRVIDANLNGTSPSSSDMDVIMNYFR